MCVGKPEVSEAGVQAMSVRSKRPNRAPKSLLVSEQPPVSGLEFCDIPRPIRELIDVLVDVLLDETAAGEERSTHPGTDDA